MRIRTQSVLFTLPVFVVLALAVAGLICVFELNETRRALREEVSSLATAVAQMVDRQELRELLGHAKADTGRTLLSRAGARIAEHGRLIRLTVEQPTGTGMALDVGPAAGEPLIEHADEPVALNGAFASLVLKRDGHVRAAVATAPVYDDAGDWVATVRAVIDAGVLDARWEECLRRTGQYVLVGTLVGLACALVLSSLVIRPLGVLGEAADRAAAGDLRGAAVPSLGRIREMNDVGSAFNTMVSILRNLLTRTRRAVFSAEQAADDERRRDACDRYLWPPASVAHGLVAFEMATVGSSEGAFGQLTRIGDALYAVMGRMPAGGGMDSALSASAVVTYVVRALEHRDADAVVREAALLFGFECMRVVCARENSSTVHSCRYDQSAGQTVGHMHDCAADGTKVYHDLGEGADVQLQLYTGSFCTGESGTVTQELLTIVRQTDPEPRGTLLVVAPRAAAEMTAGVSLNTGEYNT